MSVINQMLRDLEQRKLPSSISGNSSRHYIDEINIVAKKKINAWLFILPFILVIILCGNLYLHFVNNRTPIQSVSQKIISSDEIKKERIQAPKKEVPILESTRRTEKPIVENVEKKTVKQPIVTVQTIIKADKKLLAKVEKKNVEKLHSPKTPVKRISNSRLKTQEIKKSSGLIQKARLLMQEDQQAALKLLEANLHNIPADADYYSLLANLYQRQEQYNRAIGFYKKALKILPDKGELWIGMALAYRSKGDESNALRSFKKALKQENISPTLKHYARQQVKE